MPRRVKMELCKSPNRISTPPLLRDSDRRFRPSIISSMIWLYRTLYTITQPMVSSNNIPVVKLMGFSIKLYPSIGILLLSFVCSTPPLASTAPAATPVEITANFPLKNKSLSEQPSLFLSLAAANTSTISHHLDYTDEPQNTRFKHFPNDKINQYDDEAPLFIDWLLHLDPASWQENESFKLPLSSGLPRIVGQLPGQRSLPNGHFNEAAIPHNPVTEGPVIYTKRPTLDNLWDRIRQGLKLRHQYPGTKVDLTWYIRHKSYMSQIAQRARRYLHLIVEEVEKQNLPLEIALLPIVESAFQPFAYSHGRASGIWQFIPSTGRIYGLKQNWWYDGRRNILASTRAAITYLKFLHKKFDNDWLLALAAYNSGQGTVNRAIRKNKKRNKPTDFWSLNLPKETRGYVPKLLAISTIVMNPKKYGIKLPPIANVPYMAQVDVGSQIDLARAAELAKISVEELYLLNPAFNRWATDPNGPHQLMIPVEKQKIFIQNLATFPSDKRIQWKRHQILKGQTLSSIARAYQTSPNLISDVNQIKSDSIRIGQNLAIPVTNKNNASYVLSAEQRLRSFQNKRRPGKQKLSYRVKRGDTLWGISKRYNISYKSLARWNGLSPLDPLLAGKKLTIWQKGRFQKADFSPHSSHILTKKIGYRVRKGDSLSRISQKFNVSIKELIRWNGIRRQDYLKAGQRLTVYLDITQQAGSI